MPNVKKEIAIYIGVFDSDEQTFGWSKYKTFDKIDEGIKSFTDICSKCLTHTYDFLTKTYDSPRIDIELRAGSKMIKWFGLNEKSKDDIDKIIGVKPDDEEDAKSQKDSVSKFNLGQIVMTRGIRDYINRRPSNMINLNEALDAYRNCEWGNVDASDAKLNDEAVVSHDRILAAYEFTDGTEFWIITDAGHGTTTILFPDEY